MVQLVVRNMSGSRRAGLHMIKQGDQPARVASSARHKSAKAARMSVPALVLVRRSPTSMPPSPSALEGRLAPKLRVGTPYHSSQTSTLGDLQTGCTMLGAKQGNSSLRLATQHVHSKVPCNVPPLTARSPHKSTHFQNNAQNHTTHNTRQMFDPNRRPYATERLLLTQAQHSNNGHRRSSSCSVPVSVRAGRVDA